MTNDANTEARPAAHDPVKDYYQGWNQSLFDLVPIASKSVLEIGCASGRMGEAIKKRNQGAYYVGVEMVEDAASIAKGRLDEVHLANVESFDWSVMEGKTFDCIVFGDVLEHLLDPEKTLREAARYLAPAGCVVCCLPNVCHWSIIAGLMEGRWDYADSGLLDRTHLRFFTPATFKELLKNCGFAASREERLRTGAEVPQEIVPFLEKMKIDVPAFVDRITTYQFLYRAEKAPIPGSAPGTSWKPGAKVAARTVAVIIPVFNKVELTRACLESIAKHYPEGAAPEVLVFDNGSSDGTQAYLAEARERYRWLKAARSGANLGFARACHKSAGMVDADILLFLNNDTIVLPGWLDKMMERIGDPGVGMVGSKLIYPDGRIQHAGIVFSAEAAPTHIHHLSAHSDAEVNRPMEYPAVTGACFMIRRDLFMELGCMDTEYPMYYEDVDLCFKVRERGLKVVYQPESMVIHLEGQSSANLQDILSHNEAGKSIFFRKWKDFMLKDLAVDPRFYEAGREYRPH